MTKTNTLNHMDVDRFVGFFCPNFCYVINGLKHLNYFLKEILFLLNCFHKRGMFSWSFALTMIIFFFVFSFGLPMLHSLILHTDREPSIFTSVLPRTSLVEFSISTNILSTTCFTVGSDKTHKKENKCSLICKI